MGGAASVIVNTGGVCLYQQKKVREDFQLIERRRHALPS
jgi:hypothetical protein